MPLRLVKKAGLAIEERRQQRESIQAWAAARSAKRFMQDHLPAIWDKVAACRMTGFKHAESRERPGLWKVLPLWSCHEIPWCIQCVKADQVRRVMKALNDFHRCTPPGKQPRFLHLVVMAPIYHDGPEHTWPKGDEGWGQQASHDLAGFRRIVWEAVEEQFGHGTGGKLSYHDFGERGFAKRSPHIDMTLNGWRLDDGIPKPIPRIELKAGGLERWSRRIEQRATRLRVDAHGVNSDFAPIIAGLRPYYRVLKYQMRQLVDVRKLRYQRGSRLVEWQSYRPPYRRQPYQVAGFLADLLEYQLRLGAFGEGDRQELHVSHGHLARRSIDKAQAAFGGDDIPHGRRCPCNQCGDWDVYYPDEVDRNVRRIPDG